MEAHAEPDEPTERDHTDEWRVAPARQLATVAELEGRIDVALATARSAEEAALEIGAAGLEAAEQARRAAESAREASVTSIRSAPSALVADAPVGSIEPVDAPTDVAAPSPLDPPPAAPAANGIAAHRPDPFEDRITAFRLRAEKVMIRLQKIEAGAPPHEPTEVIRLR